MAAVKKAICAGPYMSSPPHSCVEMDTCPQALSIPNNLCSDRALATGRERRQDQSIQQLTAEGPKLPSME